MHVDRSVAGISQQRSRPVPPGLDHVGFVEDKLALIEISVAVLRACPANVTAPRFHTYYRSHGCIILVIFTVTCKVHLRKGHEGPEGEYRYSSTLSFTSALDGE